jgi:hypothetical protein
LGDANHDSHDDALAHAMTWTDPDDHNLHPADPAHDDPGHHDAVTGH